VNQETGRATTEQTQATPFTVSVRGALVALALAWAGFGWLLAGAGRESGRPHAVLYFHLAATAATLALFVAARRTVGGPRGSIGRRQLVEVFREFGAGDLVRSSGLATTLDPRLRSGVERAVEGIGHKVEELQSSSLRVAGAAEGVERGAGTLAAGAAQQAAAAGEVTAAMEELARTAAGIAEHAERQSRLVERAEAEGAAGAEAVAEAVEGVREVERRIGDVTGRADTLGTRSREIFRVLELISDIAQETHLLSLNAALEASAAGGRGRRFAVVAGEVRVLAERVRDSVASVRSQVEEFASAIRSTVVATEEGSKEAARVLDEARAATGALASLRAALAESSEAARQISSVTRQQTSATEEVLSTLRELHQVVERMSRDLGQLSGTAGRLREVGLDLQLLGQTFRVATPRSLRHLIDQWWRRIEPDGFAGADAALGELVASHGYVEAGYLADDAGKLITIRVAAGFAEREREAKEALRRVDLRERPWFRAAAEAGRAVVTPPHRSLLSDESCLTVALPIAGEDGALRGVLGFDVNVRHWTEIGR
jgi:methyl-accepting chemotaxis protein